MVSLASALMELVVTSMLKRMGSKLCAKLEPESSVLLDSDSRFPGNAANTSCISVCMPINLFLYATPSKSSFEPSAAETAFNLVLWGVRTHMMWSPCCWSNIGYNKQLQIISLQRNGCVQHGVVQHELLHSLGFNHEQSRSDRDDYVSIIYKDIIKGTEYNFMKMDTNNLDTPYDYNSVMHYGKFAFSKDGTSITIVPKPNPNIHIGQRFGMSTLDVLKINRLYNCTGYKINLLQLGVAAL
ncbi:high choriolytic enzyme 1-like [Heterodontus francisci]|uniref:high choriolytic enzyme 1-like n=1 Tax=Heterodontus francisci TaxID=7792 RepID=UPI00355B44BF